MRFFKIDLLTLLISLFIFASCERTSTIGLEVDPTNQVEGKLIDTATITSRTIKDDAAATNALSKYPFGFINDPIFGSTESSLALGVSVPSEAYSFGTNAVLDSAVLVLNFDSEFYGDSTANYVIDVHQLQNNLAKESSYLSSRPSPFPVQSSLLGTYSGKIFPKTPIKVTDVLTGAPDTIRTVSPQLRLKLDRTLISSKTLGLTETQLKTNANFQDAFKGLRVGIRENSAAGNGIMFFNFSAQTTTVATSGLVLYYRRQNATTTTAVDTVSINFPISNALGGVAAARVTHTYTTAVQNQLNNPNQQPTDVTYLQSLSGLKNKLSFPYLKKLRQNVGPMVVNKAELVVDLSSGTDVAPFRAAPRLALYKYDIAGQRKNLPDNDAGDGYTYAGDPRANPTVFGGYFDSVNKKYVFAITAYIQDLLDAKTEDYGTFLGVVPASATSANYYMPAPTLTTAGRAVIGVFKTPRAAGDKTIKLNIYYTKIN